MKKVTKANLWSIILLEIKISKKSIHFQYAPIVFNLSRPTYSIVILLWRKFICDKSASWMLINPPIVFTFTRQRWSSATLIIYLALLLKYTHYISSTYFFHLATIICFLFLNPEYRYIFSLKLQQIKQNCIPKTGLSNRHAKL